MDDDDRDDIDPECLVGWAGVLLIVWAWVLTIPASAGTAALAYQLSSRFPG